MTDTLGIFFCVYLDCEYSSFTVEAPSGGVQSSWPCQCPGAVKVVPWRVKSCCQSWWLSSRWGHRSWVSVPNSWAQSKKIHYRILWLLLNLLENFVVFLLNVCTQVGGVGRDIIGVLVAGEWPVLMEGGPQGSRVWFTTRKLGDKEQHNDCTVKRLGTSAPCGLVFAAWDPRQVTWTLRVYLLIYKMGIIL